MNPNHIGTNFDDFLKEEGIIMDDRFKFRVWNKARQCFIPEKEIFICGNGELVLIDEALNRTWVKNNPNYAVSLCTGLKDKNGKLIYEGDIVKMHGWWDASGPAGYDKDTCVVEFDKYVCGFTPMCNYDCDCCVYHEAEDCEVIGNIYENKELLNDR